MKAIMRDEREMKDSGIEWIGKIPIEWQLPQVRHYYDIDRGRVIAKTEVKSTALDGYYPVYSSQTKNNGCMGYINTFDYAKEGLTWTTDGANAGTVFYREGYYNCTNVCGILTAKKDNINVKYSSYSIGLSAYNCRREDINGYKIMSNEMAAIHFVCPNSINEQQTIANYLDDCCSKIDTIIAEAKASIEEYKELKQTVIYEAVTKGLDKNVEMKDSGVEWIGKIAATMVVKKIKYVTHISRGLFGYRPRNASFLYDGPYPFIQTGDVAKSNHYITEYKQTLSEEGKNISRQFPKGTLTMTIAANVGDVSILGFDAYFPDSVLGFVPFDKYSSEYLYYIFSTMKEEFVLNAISNTQLNLNVERVKELYIPVEEDVENQCKIIEYLDDKIIDLESLISEKQALIEDLESYKKSLIYEVVTGKRKVVE